MKKLLVFMKDYKKEAVAAPVFKLLEASFELLVPLVVADIIDKGINAPGGGDSGYIALMCLLMVGLGVVGLASTVAAQYFAAKASAGFVRGIRDALFRHINSLSFAQTDAMGASTLITRMTSDANQVQTGMNLTLRLLLRSPFYRAGRGNHGLHGGCKGGAGVRRCNTAARGCDICNNACLPAHV